MPTSFAILWILRRFPALLPKLPFDLARPLWGAVLLVVIVAPLVEESIFRGIFLPGFVVRYGTARGVALGAILFAAVHLEPVQLPATMVIGLLFGWWFVQLRSIWPGVFGHALNNSIALVGEWWDPRMGEGAVHEFTWAEPAAATIGAIMLAWSVMVLRRKFQSGTLEKD